MIKAIMIRRTYLALQILKQMHEFDEDGLMKGLETVQFSYMEANLINISGGLKVKAEWDQELN